MQTTEAKCYFYQMKPTWSRVTRTRACTAVNAPQMILEITVNVQDIIRVRYTTYYQF